MALQWALVFATKAATATGGTGPFNWQNCEKATLSRFPRVSAERQNRSQLPTSREPGFAGDHLPPITVGTCGIFNGQFVHGSRQMTGRSASSWRVALKARSTTFRKCHVAVIAMIDDTRQRSAVLEPGFHSDQNDPIAQ